MRRSLHIQIDYMSAFTFESVIFHNNLHYVPLLETL